ncbi:MAG: macro domain-containing protein [Shimia sp.]|uniref:macro domain-containing protein n=1 Tax=Shimia sp. TaxID=1954381 RepID=UPI001B0E5742|nr:macro domain-containing protein [Shimia sp.]MBO6898667.1 macro domain-containing protein [Shimia sp.]
MKTIEGDLIALTKSGTFDVMVHGCNCFCTMGAGIAKAIASQFPEAFQADLETVKGDRNKLGTYSSTLIINGDHKFHIVNAYSQYKYNGPQPRVSYEAVAEVFQRIASDFAGLRIGYPLIGAGLAGGDWHRIASSIEGALKGMDHSLVILPETKISKVSK